MEQEGIFQLNRYLGAGHFLVRHPGPFKTESLFGYLLRLSEVNGYWSVWPLLKFAGMKQFEARTAGMRVEKIAKVAKRPLSELEKVAYYVDDDYTHCRLLNHPLLPTHLRLTKPAFCPVCVKETRHIEAHWDLIAVTGCAVHGCQLRTSCPNCPRKLTIFRKGLLTCACGADLSETGLPAIPVAERELNDVIRRTVLRMPPLKDSQAGLPIQHLAGLKLHSLLGLIHVLSLHSRKMHSGSSEDVKTSDTTRASELLSKWPVRFHELLKSMITNEEAEFAGFSRGVLSPLYSGLFKSQTIPDRTQVEFVLQACADFVVNHWGMGLVDKKLLKRSGIGETGRFIGIGSMARKLGLHQKTTRRLMKSQAGAINVTNTPKIERLVIDRHTLAVNALLPGRIYWLREAAAKIGISVVLLKSLRKAGDYAVLSTPSDFRGFHEKDLDAFSSRIRASADAAVVMAEPTIQFRAALHELRFSFEAQHELIRRILERTVPVAAPETAAISDLIVQEQDVTSVLRKVCPWYSETVTARDAARLVGLSQEDIRPLADNKFLESQKTPLGERFTRSSVEQFRQAYVPAEILAKSLGTSSRKVMAICRHQQFPLLIIEVRDIDHSLIRTQDESRVRHAFEFPDRPVPVGLDSGDQSARSAGTNGGEVKEIPKETRLFAHHLASAGDTLAYREAAVKLRVGKGCVRHLIEAKQLCETPTALGSRITRTSIEQFAADYVSLQAIAEEQNTQPRTVRKICEVLKLPLLAFQSRQFNHSFVNRKDSSLIRESLESRQPELSLSVTKERTAEEAA